jgi:protein phosphatase
MPLTRDHTVVSEQARMGLISDREAAESETRHVLSRSLGNGMFVGADTSEHMVLSGDVLLLCSDGLHGAISAGEMAKIVTGNGDLNVAARQLIDAANQSDGGDNVSVQLIRVRSVERIGMYRGRPYKLA